MAEALTPIVDTTYPNEDLKARYDQGYAFFNHAYEAFVPLYSELAGFTK